MSSTKSKFASIDPTDLARVSGGASRVSSRAGGGSNDQLALMLTQITESIKGLANQQSGSDPMQMMLMMMMMGGLGGGGGGAAPAAAQAAAPQPPLPVINVQVKRNCG